MSLVSIRLSTLHEGQKVRPAGYFDRVIAVAVKVDEQRVWLDEEVYASCGGSIAENPSAFDWCRFRGTNGRLARGRWRRWPNRARRDWAMCICD